MTSQAEQAAEIIKSKNGGSAAETAIIVGRNFSAVAELAERAVVIRYADLPGFPTSPAMPDGEVLLCTVDGAPTLLLKGCATFGESGDPSLMASPIETLALLGARSILAVSSATSVNAQIVPSSLVAITDHIDFKGLNPLIGAPGDKNFINLSDAYDKRQLRRLKSSATAAGVGLQEGVFMWFSGPSFETPAEVKVARLLGADVMGSSLVAEAILAKRFAVPFAAVAVVTDFGAGFSGGAPVNDFSRGPVVSGMIAMRRIVRAFVKMR